MLRRTIPPPAKKAGRSGSSRSHDKFYRSIFSDRQDAAALLHIVLARKLPRLLERIDLAQLVVLPLELHTDDAGDRFQDKLFAVPLRETGQFLPILAEHQSTVDHDMDKRVNEYVKLIAEANERGELVPLLPFVIPVVVYGNREHRRWRTEPPPGNDAVREIAALAVPYIKGPFLLVNLDEFEEQELWDYAEDPRYRAAALTLLLLKIAPGHKSIDQHLAPWHDSLVAVNNDGPAGVAKIVWMLLYITRVCNTPADRLSALAASLGHDVEERYMTTSAPCGALPYGSRSGQR